MELMGKLTEEPNVKPIQNVEEEMMDAPEQGLAEKIKSNPELLKLEQEVKEMASEYVKVRDQYMTENDNDLRKTHKESMFVKHQALEEAMEEFAVSAAKAFEDFSPKYKEALSAGQKDNASMPKPEYNISKYRQYIEAVKRQNSSKAIDEEGYAFKEVI